jgi:hypothetical protein
VDRERERGHRKQRLAANEVLFREVNERIRQLTRKSPAANGEAREFTCECANVSCGEHVPVSLLEYERIRAHPNQFLVVPGHLDLDVETVVAERGAFWVVEKHMLVGEQEGDLDPRS